MLLSLQASAAQINNQIRSWQGSHAPDPNGNYLMNLTLKYSKKFLRKKFSLPYHEVYNNSNLGVWEQICESLKGSELAGMEVVYRYNNIIIPVVLMPTVPSYAFAKQIPNCHMK